MSEACALYNSTTLQICSIYLHDRLESSLAHEQWPRATRNSQRNLSAFPILLAFNHSDMGNVFSPPSPPPTIATSLHVLGDREATVAMKREAFRHVQVEFAPVINCSAAYSEELRRVHALKYRVWEPPPDRKSVV